ncbi:MAG: NnrS family protein [Betaproteobacteria bacterium]
MNSAHPAVAPRFALWDLGFRPFYLLASVFAAISVPLWVCQYAGFLPAAYMKSMVWHGHEMLFGYVLAVITGFLFTAVRNWSGQPTPTGGILAAFALLWIAGRVLVLTPFDMAAALVNAAFPIAVAIGIAMPMLRGGNRRNYFFVPLLCLLGLATLSLHLSYMGVFAWPQLASLQVGFDVVLFIMAVVSGRVMPMFTNNGVPGAGATSKPIVEKLALGSVLVLLAADLLQAPAPLIAIVALLAAGAHAARLMLWHPWRTAHAPLVWILHTAYAWIVVYLLLRALAAVGLLAEPLAVHALTIGAIGSMTIGMMTRTARGHTGRTLATDGFEQTCFVLIQFAAVSRVLGGIFLTNFYVATVIFSSVCWSMAFAIYAIRYWPILTRPRIDGKPG